MKRRIVKYNATYDAIFNALFINKPESLADLFNALDLDVKINKEDITYKPQRVDKGVKLKTSIMDVRFSILNEMDVALEMQNQKPTYDLFNRFFLYLSTLAVEAAKKTDNYINHNNYVIGLLNFNLFDDNVSKRIFRMNDDYGHKMSIGNIVIVELTKLNKYGKTRLEEWYGLLEANDLTDYIGGGDYVMKKSAEEIERLNNEEAILLEAFYEEQERYHQNSERIAREMKMKEAVEQGLQQGIEQGLQQGIEQGIDKGKSDAKSEIVVNLRNLGFDIEMIEKAVRLNQQDIIVILNNNNIK